MGIGEKQARLTEEFSAIPQWEDRYKRIIDKARKLAPMAQRYKTDDNKVRGCSSTVWLHAGMRDGQVVYAADSDAILVRGLIALLLEVYSGETPAEILAASPKFIEDLGLNANLSPNRANGVTAMIKQIRNYALAFQVMLQRGMSPPTLELDQPPKQEPGEPGC